MIKKITIRDVASYDKDGVVFDNLQKVNFIYGGNGCGKTTLSRALEKSNIQGSRRCKVTWEEERRDRYLSRCSSDGNEKDEEKQA